MPETQNDLDAVSRLVRALGALHALTLEAFQAQTRAELQFFLLNETCRFAPYDRAALWELSPGGPKLLGVSGQPEEKRNAPLAEEWRGLLLRLLEPETPGVLSAERFGGGEAYAELRAKTGGLDALWLPLRARGRTAAGLWLERWGGGKWRDEETEGLKKLAQGYGTAWERFAPAGGRAEWASPRRLAKWGAAAALAALLLVPVRLRVVAPCEVEPLDPVPVTAPLNGVVERLDVTPEARVEAGAQLFHYDRRLADKELEVARQEVGVAWSQLESAEARAFGSDEARADIPVLRDRLRQAEGRLRLVEAQAKCLEVYSPCAGVARAGDPAEWQGRAVRVGERVLTVVDPERTLLRIWVPEADNLEFDPAEPVKAYLSTGDLPCALARLEYVSRGAALSPAGVPGFAAEARWAEGQAGPRLGLRGVAVLRGKRSVPLGYWLLRKPITSLRLFLGI